MPKFAGRNPNGASLSHTTGAIGRAMGVTGRAVYAWCQDGLMKASVIPGQRRLRIREQDARVFASRYGFKFNKAKL